MCICNFINILSTICWDTLDCQEILNSERLYILSVNYNILISISIMLSRSKHMGPTQQIIEQKIADSLDYDYLDVTNESHMHNVPEGSESHFKIVISSAQFEGKNLVARHRMINSILKEELSNSIHALALHTYTPEQWSNIDTTSPQSPPCLGGGKD